MTDLHLATLPPDVAAVAVVSALVLPSWWEITKRLRARSATRRKLRVT